MRIFNGLNLNKFALNSLWSVLGFGISQGSSLIAFIILARLLTKDDVSSFALMQNTIAVGMACCGFWIGTGVTRFAALNSNINKDLAGKYSFLGILSSLILSGFAAILIFYYSENISKILIGSGLLEPYLKLISIVIVFHSVDSVQIQTLQSLVAFKEISKNNLIKACLYLPIMTFFTYKYSLHGTFYGLILMGFFNLVINFYSVRKYFVIHKIQYSSSIKLKNFNEFYQYALPLFIGALLGTPVILAANAILSQGNLGIQEVAYFAIASQWRSLIQHIPKRMTDVALPMLSDSIGVKNEDDFSRTFKQTNAFSILIGCTLVTFLFFNVVSITNLYGEGYAGAKFAIGLLLFAGGISCFGSGIGPYIYSKGYTKFGLFTNIVWTTTFLITSIMFIDKLGATALALGMTLGYLINLTVTIVYLAKNNEINLLLLYKSYLGIFVMFIMYLVSINLHEDLSKLNVFFLSIFASLLVFFTLINYIIPKDIKHSIYKLVYKIFGISYG
jgi:O-antigen/teichoic acid export membrane protein